MDSYKSSLSGGALIRSALLECEAIAGTVTQIFPVVTAEATLPYICYRRSALQTIAVKEHASDDTAIFEVMVCAESYDASVELAEAVRHTLDGRSIAIDGLGIAARRCTLTDASESFESDAYIQLLKFNLKIQ